MADQAPQSKTGTSPWVSSSGILAHPSAPPGGGGPGNFRIGTHLGTEGNDSDPIPHPLAPDTRYRVLTNDDAQVLQDQGVPMDNGTVKVIPTGGKTNPPPATQPTTFKNTKGTVAGKVEIDVDVEVLADGKDTRAGREWNARTVMDPKAVKGKEVKANYPTYEIDAADAGKLPTQQKILALKGAYTVKGKVTLQIQYGTSAKPTSPAAYGRGTTTQDVQNGDTTVGFHESCHMADFVSWLKNKAFPVVNLKLPMTVDQYDKATAAGDAAIEKYFADAEAESKRNTDEIGNPTLTDYKKSHSGYEH